MPSRVKLLNNVVGGATGNPIKIGMGQQPYSIRVAGGFTLGGGGAGTKGVHIESSPDDGVTWQREIGEVGGINFTEAITGELTDLPDGTIAIIKHYTKHIRALTGSGLVGNATVWLEMGR